MLISYLDKRRLRFISKSIINQFHIYMIPIIILTTSSVVSYIYVDHKPLSVSLYCGTHLKVP